MSTVRARLVGQSVFYPAAAAYALLAVPLHVAALTGTAGVPPALADPRGHAHEMLLGFALAVVTGNQLGPASPGRIWTLLALWLTARAAWLAAPAGLAATLADAAFGALFAMTLTPRLFRSARKLRNRALPLLLVALGLAPLGFALVQRAEPLAWRGVIAATLLLLALLMAFMGGRILSASIGGHLQRRGEAVAARVQPRLEGALLAAGALALAAILAGAASAAAAAAMAMGALVLARLARWRPWRLRGRPDLLCMLAGYAWLGAGLTGTGAAALSEAWAWFPAALHLITVGALGTLTLNVMAAGWLLRARRDPACRRALPWATALLAAATSLRVLASVLGPAWLWASAACWSAAFAMLLALFASAPARGPGRDVEEGESLQR